MLENSKLLMLASHVHYTFFRDIKPENVLINLITNKVTLIDFGSGDFIQENFYTTYDGKWEPIEVMTSK